MKLKIHSLLLCPIFLSSLNAEPMGPGHVPNTPQLPDSPYRVHDGTRPAPKPIQNVQAVTIAAPSDAKILFDGSSLDAWKAGKNGKSWTIREGVLVANEAGDLESKEHFDSFQIHLEWRIPADRKIEGQTGGNSGIFLHGLYEIQILESHAHPSYPDGQAGAIYGQKPPLVNATTAQGTWQSYDIIFQAPKVDASGKVVENPKVSVLHNGAIVQHATEILGGTQYRALPKYPESTPSSGPVRLQWHGDPIEFRNIWIRPLGQHDNGTPVQKK